MRYFVLAVALVSGLTEGVKTNIRGSKKPSSLFQAYAYSPYGYYMQSPYPIYGLQQQQGPPPPIYGPPQPPQPMYGPPQPPQPVYGPQQGQQQGPPLAVYGPQQGPQQGPNQPVYGPQPGQQQGSSQPYPPGQASNQANYGNPTGQMFPMYQPYYMPPPAYYPQPQPYQPPTREAPVREVFQAPARVIEDAPQPPPVVEEQLIGPANNPLKEALSKALEDASKQIDKANAHAAMKLASFDDIDFSPRKSNSRPISLAEDSVPIDNHILNWRELVGLPPSNRDVKPVSHDGVTPMLDGSGRI